jgi:sialate O-acetylesterase
LKVPIGLINASYGGTSIEAWISREKLLEDDSTAAIVKEWDRVKADVPAMEADYAAKTKAWEEAAAQAKAAGKPAPERPRFHPFARPQARPAAFYNTCIAPLIPFATRGVIWYQGESGGEPYGTLLTALISDWRARFDNPDWPFCVGQLHNVGPVQTDPNEPRSWGPRRDAQLRVAQTMPHVGLTVSIDLGIVSDTHYPNKQEVGRRMSLWALAQVYGRPVVCSGPVFRSAQTEGKQMRLQFDHTEGGLAAKGERLTGFTIAGEDRKFHWAEASLDAETVVVSSPDVPQPVAVRYGWAMNPPCNLYNGARLPAAPFRTDNW